jgi:hypothetical protein
MLSYVVAEPGRSGIISEEKYTGTECQNVSLKEELLNLR